MKFTEATITDAKRLVRGEHWRMVQAHFRREQRKHQPVVRVITLAGGSPHEEIACIRSLLPRAQIIAVDVDPQCCEAARDAAADDALCVDLFDWDGSKVPKQIQELGAIDVVNLDLCGGITRNVERAVTYYGRLVRTAGVLMVSFSYGRDVSELFSRDPWCGIPAPLAGRVKYLHERTPTKEVFGGTPTGMTFSRSVGGAQMKRMPVLGLTSVIAYRGASMPMCACLWEGHCDPEQPSFVNVTDDDLMAAVLTQLEPVDVSRLYAVPAERIQHFRRKRAAAKAAVTRQARSDARAENDEKPEPEGQTP